MTSRNHAALIALFISLVGLWATPSAALAQSTVRDHPLVSRFNGSEVLEYKSAEFDEFQFPLGPITGKDTFINSARLEGKVMKFKYNVPENHSGLEVARSYQEALQAGGFQILFKCDGKECFSEQFPYGYTGTASGIWCTNCEEPMRYVAAKLARPSGDVLVSVVVEKDKYEGGAWLSVIETKSMPTGQVMVNAEALAREIVANGHAALYGIYFDTGMATIRPDSGPAVAEVASLMSAQPALRLYVIGHTDNVGSVASNLSLSQERAEAVVRVLVRDYAIDSSRLSATGVGPLAPVAANSNDDGRARNRRVELVGQ